MSIWCIALFVEILEPSPLFIHIPCIFISVNLFIYIQPLLNMHVIRDLKQKYTRNLFSHAWLKPGIEDPSTRYT
jgi:hypothetical protein